MFLSLLGIRGTNFISSFGNQRNLNFGVMAMRGVRKTLFTFVPECSKNIVYVRSRTFERH